MKGLIPFLHLIGNHLGEFLLLGFVKIPFHSKKAWSRFSELSNKFLDSARVAVVKDILEKICYFNQLQTNQSERRPSI